MPARPAIKIVIAELEHCILDLVRDQKKRYLLENSPGQRLGLGPKFRMIADQAFENGSRLGALQLFEEGRPGSTVRLRFGFSFFLVHRTSARFYGICPSLGPPQPSSHYIHSSSRDILTFLRYDIVYDVRMVLDTDVVIAAMRSPTGASAAILRSIRPGQATLLLSVPLAIEYEAVCRKAEQRLAAGLSERQVDIFVNAVIAMAEPVETHFLWRPQLRDPNDEMVLEAAVNGRANALVTFNLRDYGNAPGRFGVDLLLPRAAIGRMRQ